jgi:4-amino-4-deoxy-L-arabinose transferase-like glycosyltransferase
VEVEMRALVNIYKRLEERNQGGFAGKPSVLIRDCVDAVWASDSSRIKLELKGIGHVMGHRPARESFFATVHAKIGTLEFWGVVCAFAIAAYMIFIHLGLTPLIDPDEGRNASVAWEMRDIGHWLVPTYDGMTYLDKPSFFFKLVAFSFSIFGQNEFAARLPSALFALGTLVVVFYFCRREYDLRTATIAVIVVGTAPLFIIFARYVIFDMTLAFFDCAAIVCGYFAEASEEKARRHWYLAMAVAIGFALLVKGPVGFIVPALVLSIFNAIDGTKGALKRLLSLRNFAVILAIFLPWFIGVSLLHHDFPYYGVVRESLMRFTTGEFHRTEPFYFYPPVLLATLLFWSLLLPQAAWAAWRERGDLARSDRLLIVWIIAITFFFSVSQSKLPGYVLTVAIALGIFIARIFAAAWGNRPGPDAKIVRNAGIGLVFTAFACAAALFMYRINPALIEYRIHMKDAAAFPDIRAVSLPLALLFILTAVLSATGILRKDARLIFLGFLALPLAIMALVLPVIGNAEQFRNDRLLAAEISSLAGQDQVACVICFPPGLPFYLGRPIMVFTANNGDEIKSNYIEFFLASSPSWPPQVVPVSRFETWMSENRAPVFLMTEMKYLPILQALASERHLSVHELAGGRYWGVLVTPPQGDD